MIDKLDDTVRFYKVGLELFVSPKGASVVKLLLRKRKKVFLDLKMFDVPNTVGAAVACLSELGVSFVSVHGSDAVFKEAVKKKRNDLKILAVTVLTSFDQNDIKQLGFKYKIKDLVLLRAGYALKRGCDGVVSSGREAKFLRDKLPDDYKERMIIVTPGIRPEDDEGVFGPVPGDDQKRKVDIETAFANGADYIVVGRPISKAPNPSAAAENIQQRIKTFFEKNKDPRPNSGEKRESSLRDSPPAIYSSF